MAIQNSQHFNKRKYDSVKKEEPEEVEVKEDKDSAKRAKVYHQHAKLKKWRMIIRNLPFKTTRADLQNVCSKIGCFKEIVLPVSKKMEGRCAGFAFVQFALQEDAEKAKEWFNNNKFLGRMVAADWAIDKDSYETANHEEKKKLKEKVKEENTEEKKNINKKNDQEDESGDEEMDDEEVSDDSDNSDDESDDEKESDEEGAIKAKGPKKGDDKALSENRVVFLRNLSFDTEQESLKEYMKRFGTVQVAVICKFHDSGHSKGTAFIHFSSAEEADKCVKSSENGELIIDGRSIHVALALPREKVTEIEKDKFTKVPKDKRNLRLLRFGLVREGTAAAKGMSAEDSTKRIRLAEAARKKLENLQMFVSPVRLVIHNLPGNITDDKLWTICKEAGGADAFVKECKVWREKSTVDTKKLGKSKGFAFVAFTEHKHALNCLQKLNNNAKTFTNEKRPIVEFSIENLAALQAKERRKNTGENTVSIKEINEKVKKQVQASVGEIHASGMKFLPKFLGKKMRHRDMSKTKQKKLKVNKTKQNSKPKEVKKAAPGGITKKNAKKTVTKYLTMG